MPPFISMAAVFQFSKWQPMTDSSPSGLAVRIQVFMGPQKEQFIRLTFPAAEGSTFTPTESLLPRRPVNSPLVIRSPEAWAASTFIPTAQPSAPSPRKLPLEHPDAERLNL